VYALLFSCTFLFDCFLFISKIFYFNWIDFLDNAIFLKFHSSFLFIIPLIIGFVFIFLKFQHFLYTKLIVGIPNRISLVYLVIFTSFLIATDILNGSSSLLVIPRTIPQNIVGSEINSISNLLRASRPSDNKPVTFKCNSDSISTSNHYFSELNTSKKQLVIIVESWGILRDFDYKKLNSFFLNRIGKEYTLYFDSSCFSGSTTNAELREFLNQNGGYAYYFKNTIYNNKKFSLFEVKNKNFYTTIGVHSFSKEMFFRHTWWKNIGIEHTFFLEDMLKTNSHYKINTETIYQGLFDEDSYDFLNKEASKYEKVFAYLLTVNSHLGFTDRGGYSKKDLATENYFKSILKNYPSSIVPQQVRIFNELDYFLSHLDAGKWDEVLLIGDHAPPYFYLSDRINFNQEKVPFIFLKRKAK
jgi:hypothetical protein